MANLDYGVLKTEITTDPDTLGYSGKNAVQKATLLNTPGNLLSPAKSGTGWTKSQPLVSIVQVAQWAATADTTTGNTPIDMITTASKSTTVSSAVRGAALTALTIFGGGFISLDVSNPANQSILAALVTASLVTAAQEATLAALGSVPCSRAEALFFAGVVVTIDDVNRVGG